MVDYKNIVVCEDDKMISDKYRGLITSLAKKHDISVRIHVCESGEQLLFQIEEIKPDIVYLDILMGELNGIDTAKKIRELGAKTQIIFLTSSREYVFDAFDVMPLQYLVKESTTKQQFEEVFLKGVALCKQREKEIIVCKSRDEMKTIELDHIYYFEVIKRIIIVYYKDGFFEYYSSMKQLESKLEQKFFARSHRSFMVNLKYVTKIHKEHVHLENNQKIPLGERYMKEFKMRFSNYLSTQCI